MGSSLNPWRYLAKAKSDTFLGSLYYLWLLVFNVSCREGFGQMDCEERVRGQMQRDSNWHPTCQRSAFQLTPRGGSRCWAATGSKWDDESANVVFEVWTRTGSGESKKTTQLHSGKIHGNVEVVKPQTTGASSVVSAVGICRYLGLGTTESRPFFQHCHHFLLLLFHTRNITGHLLNAFIQSASQDHVYIHF